MYVETLKGAVGYELCDPMGHMNTRHYAALFDQATVALFAELGAPHDISGERGWADIVHHTEFKCELLVGHVISIRSCVSEVGRTSLSYRHELFKTASQEIAALLRGKAVRFDLRNRKAVTLEEPLATYATSVIEAADRRPTDRSDSELTKGGL